MSNIVERLDEIIAKNVALEISGMSEAIKAHYRSAFCGEAADAITRLQAENEERRKAQPYVYIGKDGKSVLARDLEDRLLKAEAELSRMTAWRKEEFERAERMADDWAEFCKALDLEWGDQQHAVNQIVAKFNKAAKEARAEALEEAAKVADDKVIGMVYQSDLLMANPIEWGKAQARGWMANEIAAAIRRLKEGATPEPVPSLAKLFDDMAAKQRSINDQFDEFMSDVEEKP